MYSVKQCKAYMKKNGVKGTSKYNKQQLNTKMLDVSNEKYKTRKNIKQYTTAQLVYYLTKNKTTTNHIMSYLVNTTYYDYIKNTVHFEILHELQLFELETYVVMVNMPTDTVTLQNKERMLSIHNHLVNNPITTKIEFSRMIIYSLESNKDYCENWLSNLNDNRRCHKNSLTKSIFLFNNDKRFGGRLAYSYN